MGFGGLGLDKGPVLVLVHWLGIRHRASIGAGGMPGRRLGVKLVLVLGQ